MYKRQPREFDREEGIQRNFKPVRSKAIAEYIDSDDSIMANNIIINLELRKINLTCAEVFNNNEFNIDKIISKAKELNYPVNKIAFVIDGQHRLRAFDYTKIKNFNLIVTALVDLTLAEVAELFVKINYYQVPVNKSIVFDLLGINPKIFPEYFILHRIINRLNEELESPFFNQIKMLGMGNGFVSQATLISAIDKYKLQITIKNTKITTDEENIIYNILWIYFNTIKQQFLDLWNSNTSIITKSVGIRALIWLINDYIIEYQRKNKEFNLKNLTADFNKVNADFWDSVSNYGGEKGVRIIYDNLKKIIFN